MIIGHASKNENGSYATGKKGDQTGQEVCMREWYSRPWTHILRANTPKMRNEIADAVEWAVVNDNIGYSQNDRNSLRNVSSKVGYKLCEVNEPCNCDCSSLVTVACLWAEIDPSRIITSGNCATTSTLRSQLIKTGHFSCMSDKLFLSSPDYLIRGDILLYEGHHVAVALQNGKYGMQWGVQ